VLKRLQGRWILILHVKKIKKISRQAKIYGGQFPPCLLPQHGCRYRPTWCPGKSSHYMQLYSPLVCLFFWRSRFLNRIGCHTVSKLLRENSWSYCVYIYIWRTVHMLTVGWNRRGQHEYLVTYNFKLKSAFDAESLLLMPVSFLAVHCALWLKHTSNNKGVCRSEYEMPS